MCLFHDLVEARTGDLNYVNKKYVKADEEAAVRDMTADLPFGEEIRLLADEFNARATPEAEFAHDADQIEMILQLKELGDLGNRYARDWIDSARKRLRTDDGNAPCQKHPQHRLFRMVVQGKRRPMVGERGSARKKRKITRGLEDTDETS